MFTNYEDYHSFIHSSSGSSASAERWRGVAARDSGLRVGDRRHQFVQRRLIFALCFVTKKHIGRTLGTNGVQARLTLFPLGLQARPRCFVSFLTMLTMIERLAVRDQLGVGVRKRLACRGTGVCLLATFSFNAKLLTLALIRR